jgi:hypothetical protein
VQRPNHNHNKGAAKQNDSNIDDGPIDKSIYVSRSFQLLNLSHLPARGCTALQRIYSEREGYPHQNMTPSYAVGVGVGANLIFYLKNRSLTYRIIYLDITVFCINFSLVLAEIRRKV